MRDETRNPSSRGADCRCTLEPCACSSLSPCCCSPPRRPLRPHRSRAMWRLRSSRKTSRAVGSRFPIPVTSCWSRSLPRPPGSGGGDRPSDARGASGARDPLVHRPLQLSRLRARGREAPDCETSRRRGGGNESGLRPGGKDCAGGSRCADPHRSRLRCEELQDLWRERRREPAAARPDRRRRTDQGHLPEPRAR